LKKIILCLLLLTITTCVQAKTQKSTEVQQLIDKTCRQMIFVKGGTFMMGDPVQPFVDIINEAVRNGDRYSEYMSSERNRPVHKVTLDSYYMGTYEVTYDDYDVYTRATGMALVREDRRHNPIMYSPQKPVDISWNRALDYCQWLGEQTGLLFDLPTEAQWEYAARNRGQNVVFATDTGLLEPGRNFTRFDIPVFEKFPEDVGLFAPSPMGFYNLSDNAAEWVKDWYAKDYYQHSPEKNPQGPKTGTFKVSRGGGSRLDGTTVAREKSDYLNKNVSAGLRCVINTDKPLPKQE